MRASSEPTRKLTEERAAFAPPESPATPAPPAATPAEGLVVSRTAALALAAFGLALIGQFFFKNVGHIVDGFVFFGIASVLFLVAAAIAFPTQATVKTRPGWWHTLVAQVRRTPARAGLIALGFILGYSTFRSLKTPAPDINYWRVFAIWAIGFSSYALAFARRPRFDVATWWREYRWDVAIGGGLFSIALAARLVNLGQVPNIVSGDEGRIGLLGLAAANGEIQNLFATTYGHSTFYLHLIGFFMRVFGPGPMGLRFTSAVGGALSVPALYILIRHMFGRRVAFLSAALLAASHMHLHFSRIIVAGGIQDALFAIITFYFLLTGLEKRSPMRLVLAALVTGLHLYIYMGARLVILLIPVYIVALAITNPKLVRDNIRGLLAMAGMLLIMVIPMAIFATAHPDDFMARVNQTGVIQSGWLASEVEKLGQTRLHILANLLLQAFLTANYYPATGFYNSPLPMLDFLSGALFMLGIVFSLFRVFDRRHLLIQGWYWSGVISGGALVVLPAIGAYRILIVFPAVCVFVALAVDKLLDLTFRPTPVGGLLKGVLVVAFALIVGNTNMRAYFVDYGPSCLYEDWGTRFASYMGAELGQAGPGTKAFLLGYPRIWYGIHPSVDYLSGKIPITDIREPLMGPGDPVLMQLVQPGEKAIFFFTPDRAGELPLVQESLPGGQVRQIEDCKNPMLTIYQVGGAGS